MKKVSCQDTEISERAKYQTHREAILHEQYARLAAAKAALEELHDDGELDTSNYYVATMELTRCMGIVDATISQLQLEAELMWPEPRMKPVPNVDTDRLYIPSSNGCFEITRLRMTAP